MLDNDHDYDNDNELPRDFCTAPLGVVVIALLCALMAAPSLAQQAVGVYGDYRNRLVLPPGSNPPADQSSSAAFFGGHVKLVQDADGNWVEPGNGTIKLASSSFGQMVARTIPYPDFEQVALDHARKRLYWDYADGSPDYPKDSAALRYKTLLYRRENRATGAGGTESVVVPRFEDMASLWGSAERARALEAADGIAAVLRYSPSHQGLRNALLDILYEVAIADVLLAKELEADAVRAGMGFPGYEAVADGYAITEEIEFLEQAVSYYAAAAQPYFELLSDRLGVGTGVAGDAVIERPFGYLMFYQQVPTRSIYAPTFKDDDGLLRPVLDENGDGLADEVLTGFKDLILLFQIERDMARVGARLAKLYALRAYHDDRQQAYEVIGTMQQRAYTDGRILNGIFSDAELALLPDYSGLSEARAGWAQGLSSLSTTKGFLDGDANPLGLSPDFLALVQNDNGDSYGFYEGLLIPGGDSNHLGGALGDAYIKYQDALASYDTFRHYQDRLADELDGQRRSHGDRLRAIVGCEYPEAPDPDSCYHSPESNEGGEIYQQLKNIEQARLRIAHNAQEVENLQRQIEIEIERRGREAGVNDLIAKTYVQYGNKQAKLTEELGVIQGAMAFANAMAQASSSFFGGSIGGGFSNAANAVVQQALAIKAGRLSAKKERLAAQQSADITYLSDRISGYNSQATVKTLLLGMSTLAIESSEAAVVLAQEHGRLTALLDEQAYLEAQWAEANSATANRYFADPSHRIIQNQKVLAAARAFDRAQLWVFIMARALDYKWNRRVVTDGEPYTANSVFRLRNAQELVDMAIALNEYDKFQQTSNRHGDQSVRFSVREDFLGYRRVDVATGELLTYPDPVTGQQVDALTAFRSYLKQLPRLRPDWGTNREVVRIEFDTVKTNFQGTFFSPDRWNEKINWIAIKINAESGLDELSVWLEQSGVSFVRNEWRGEMPDPERPDLVIEEMTAYPVAYWYRETDPDTGAQYWTSKDSFGIPVNAAITRDPDAPIESYRKKEFHELPPAVSRWALEIPVVHASGAPLLDLDRVSDIEIQFYNYYLVRN
jgi:hypothetical protein